MFNKKEYKQQYYLKNQAKYQKESQERYLKNRERILARQKELLKSETPEIKQKKKEYRINYRKVNQSRLRDLIQTDKSKYQQYRRSARSRNYEFSLSFEEFIKIFHSNCVYCGGPRCRGIDRVDNSKGYTPENSTACCDFCNKMKWRHTKDEFIAHVIKIATNYKLTHTHI